jgi:hypothetical protein
MSDLRRQKRKAIRESKKNLTTTKIEDDLAIALDAYLKDEVYFKKQIELCDELELEYPKNAKNGYELPLFNKNPITNEIEIHIKSTELFTSYQVSYALIQVLNTLTENGVSSDTTDYNIILSFLHAINKDVEFAKYLYDLIKIGDEKGKLIDAIIRDNYKELYDKISVILNYE